MLALRWCVRFPSSGHLVAGTTSAVVAGHRSKGFNTAQVIFATPMKFVNHLNADPACTACQARGAFEACHHRQSRIRGFSRLSLLVVDECHHAHRLGSAIAKGETNHTYAQVAQAYYRSAENARPKILGLTASPGATTEDIEGLASTLLARFVRAAPVAVPDTVVVRAEGADELAGMLNKLSTEQLEAQKEGRFTDVATIDGLLVLNRALGSGAALRDACAGLLDVKPILDMDARFGNTDAASPVFEAVFATLAAEASRQGITGSPEDDPDFRAIVFVRTQLGAKAGAEMLRQRGIPGLRSGVLLGQTIMTTHMQSNELASFRRGTINVLFATSIAEEGLDIQRCGLVIRTEPPGSILSNIQGRGRARALDAKYCVVTLTGDEVSMVKDLKGQEASAGSHLDDCISRSGEGVCGTAWSHFDEIQFDDEIRELHQCP